MNERFEFPGRLRETAEDGAPMIEIELRFEQHRNVARSPELLEPVGELDRLPFDDEAAHEIGARLSHPLFGHTNTLQRPAQSQAALTRNVERRLDQRRCAFRRRRCAKDVETIEDQPLLDVFQMLPNTLHECARRLIRERCQFRHVRTQERQTLIDCLCLESVGLRGILLDFGADQRQLPIQPGARIRRRQVADDRCIPAPPAIAASAGLFSG